MNCGSRRLAALALAAIVMLAAGLRLIALDHVPPGLFRDEAEKGYNAWCLAQSGGALEIGRDADGGAALRWTRLPWMIDVMGAPTSAIYQYASIPFVALGGLSVKTTRMAAACAGTISVLLLGLVLMRAWGPLPGAAAALWLAVSVWHLVFSRWALEGCFVPPLMCAGLAGLWGVQEGRRWGWPLAGGALGWLFYAYSGAQPFVLVWGLVLLIVYRHALLPPRWLLIGLACFLLPVVPTLIERMQPGGAERLTRLAIWGDGAGIWTVLGRFLVNYLAHFDPRFLFLEGDTNLRHGVPGWGALAHADALMVVGGLIVLVRGKHPLRGALIAALLCAPIPAALTREGIPHALRALGMLIPLAALAGLGLAAITRHVFQQPDPSTAAFIPRMRILVLILLGLCAVDYALGTIRYFRTMQQDPRAAVAFQAGDQTSWSRIAAERNPTQTVYVDARLPYALYYQCFYLKPEPRQVALQGAAMQRVIYYQPGTAQAARLESQMQSGDWLILPAPADQVLDGLMTGSDYYTVLTHIP